MPRLWWRDTTKHENRARLTLSPIFILNIVKKDPLGNLNFETPVVIDYDAIATSLIKSMIRLLAFSARGIGKALKAWMPPG
jgi:hypothetical protein